MVCKEQLRSQVPAVPKPEDVRKTRVRPEAEADLAACVPACESPAVRFSDQRFKLFGLEAQKTPLGESGQSKFTVHSASVETCMPLVQVMSTLLITRQRMYADVCAVPIGRGTDALLLMPMIQAVIYRNFRVSSVTTCMKAAPKGSSRE